MAVEDFSFEPTRTHIDTHDADMAVKMRKSVTPIAEINLKGKVKGASASGVAILCPGDVTAVANFTGATANTFDPAVGIIEVKTMKLSQGRLNTAFNLEVGITHLPHAS